MVIFLKTSTETSNMVHRKGKFNFVKNILKSLINGSAGKILFKKSYIFSFSSCRIKNSAFFLSTTLINTASRKWIAPVKVLFIFSITSTANGKVEHYLKKMTWLLRNMCTDMMTSTQFFRDFSMNTHSIDFNQKLA